MLQFLLPKMAIFIIYESCPCWNVIGINLSIIEWYIQCRVTDSWCNFTRRWFDGAAPVSDDGYWTISMQISLPIVVDGIMPSNGGEMTDKLGLANIKLSLINLLFSVALRANNLSQMKDEEKLLPSSINL